MGTTTKRLEIIKANFEARNELRSKMTDVDSVAIEEGRALTDAEQGQLDELRSELDKIDGRIQAGLAEEIRSVEITDATASLLGRFSSHDEDQHDTRSIGERFAGSDDVSGYQGRGKAGVFDQDLSFRAVTNVTLGAGSAGEWVVPQRLGRVGQDFLDRRVFLTDVLPHLPVSTGSVEYVQDKSPLADMADKAAETAEGDPKPQAGPTFDVVSEPVQTVAAWVNITRQALADVPQMRGYLDGRLRYSIRRRVDAQVIGGTGAGNIIGLANRSGIVSYSPLTPEAVYRSIRHAIRLGEDNEAVYEIIVMNPADAESFDLSNDSTAGLHAVPNVAGPGARTAWGLTQVRSTAIAAGTAMLIDPMAVAVLDRQQVSAYLTDSHASNFTSNILTLLLEGRYGLALFDPKGVAVINLDES